MAAGNTGGPEEGEGCRGGGAEDVSRSEAAEPPRMRRTKGNPVLSNKESVCDPGEDSFWEKQEESPDSSGGMWGMWVEEVREVQCPGSSATEAGDQTVVWRHTVAVVS